MLRLAAGGQAGNRDAARGTARGLAGGMRALGLAAGRWHERLEGARRARGGAGPGALQLAGLAAGGRRALLAAGEDGRGAALALLAGLRRRELRRIAGRAASVEVPA